MEICRGELNSRRDLEGGRRRADAAAFAGDAFNAPPPSGRETEAADADASGHVSLTDGSSDVVMESGLLGPWAVGVSVLRSDRPLPPPLSRSPPPPATASPPAGHRSPPLPSCRRNPSSRVSRCQVQLLCRNESRRLGGAGGEETRGRGGCSSCCSRSRCTG
jgi:hypothetical protein